MSVQVGQGLSFELMDGLSGLAPDSSGTSSVGDLVFDRSAQVEGSGERGGQAPHRFGGCEARSARRDAARAWPPSSGLRRASASAPRARAQALAHALRRRGRATPRSTPARSSTGPSMTSSGHRERSLQRPRGRPLGRAKPRKGGARSGRRAGRRATSPARRRPSVSCSSGARAQSGGRGGTDRWKRFTSEVQPLHFARYGGATSDRLPQQRGEAVAAPNGSPPLNGRLVTWVPGLGGGDRTRILHRGRLANGSFLARGGLEERVLGDGNDRPRPTS